MKIRTATILDLERILEIYAYARTFYGTDWESYPVGRWISKEGTIDQRHRTRTIVCHGGKNEIHGVFVFIIGADPTYEVIEDGAWPDNSPYGTIHRIAGDGQVKGLFAAMRSIL